MNTQKIQLALTAGLINTPIKNNALDTVIEVMNNLAHEVGNFLGLKPIGKTPIDANNIRERYALRYENCVLDLDLVSHPRANRQSVQGFKLQ